MKDVMQRIHENREQMSKGHRRIADFIVNHYDSAAFMTAATLGENVDISESTVVRFAMALGYDGYSELQKSLQELVRNKLTNIQRISLASKYNEENTMLHVMKSDVNNLRNTIANVDAEVFHGAVDCMLRSRSIYIAGHRSASVLSRFMAYYLDFVFDNVRQVIVTSQDAIDQLTRINSEDVMIGITFPRYSALTVECVRVAKDKGANVISITDGRMSPVVPYSDYLLTAQSAMASFVDSLVAPLSLINAIIVACGLHRKENVRGHFEELERMWAEYHVYSREEME